MGNLRRTVMSLAAAAALMAATTVAATAEAPDTTKTLTGVADPVGTVVDGTGDVYVSQGKGTKVEVFDSGATTANPAKTITGLDHPRGLAFDRDGNLYVANTYANNVLVFDLGSSRSTPIRTLTGVSYPAGVVIDSQGYVYVAPLLDSSLAVFPPDRTTPDSTLAVTGLERVNSLAIDSNDNIYVGQQVPAAAGVQVVPSGSQTPDPDWKLTTTAVTSLGVNSMDQLYVGHSGGTPGVDVYNPGQTAPDPALAPTGMLIPLSIGFSHDDTAFIGNSDVGVENVLVYPPVSPPAPSFDCTGDVQSYVVPDWTSQLQVTLRGAQGGGAAGGRGGKTSATVSVAPGSTIQVNVGCKGGGTDSGAGGYNGGADAGNKYGSTGSHLSAFTGGGGASDIRIGDCAITSNCGLDARVLVAGGGGGGEARTKKSFSGGAGGSPATNGKSDPALGVGGPGKAATDKAGGAGGAKASLGSGGSGSTGTKGLGGSGGDSGSKTGTGPGAGGGGGLYGGGGGGSGNSSGEKLGIGGAGGGGTSGVGPAGTQIVGAVTYSNGAQAGDGSVDITALPRPLVVATTSLADGTTAGPYSQQLQATGGIPAYTWEIIAGSLPTGLSLAPGGEISGTPTQQGDFHITVRVTDQADVTASRELALHVDAGISITTSSLPVGSVGVAYDETLVSQGGTGAASWEIDSGSLPDGLTLNGATGQISGTADSPGTKSFVVKVTGNDSSTATAPLSIVVTEELVITTESPLPDAIEGSLYSAALVADGGQTPYAWSISSGSLPDGLNLDPGTGVISGMPTATGTSTFHASVLDDLGTTKSKEFTITVNDFVHVVTSDLPKAVASKAYSTQLEASGGSAPYAWSIDSGALPEGLHLQQHTGVISGDPLVAETAAFTVEVVDANGEIDTRDLGITVQPAPAELQIDTTSVPEAALGERYVAEVKASGGKQPYRWAVTSGSLPAGVSLNADTGTISGTPTDAGRSDFELRVTDDYGTASSRQFTLTVASDPPTVSVRLNNVAAKTPAQVRATYDVTVAGGSAATGSAHVMDGTRVVCTANIVQGAGSCSGSLDSVGQKSLKASFSGSVSGYPVARAASPAVTTQSVALIVSKHTLSGKKCPRQLLVAGTSAKKVTIDRKKGSKWVSVGSATPKADGSFGKKLTGNFDTIKLRVSNSLGKSPVFTVKKPPGQKCS